MQMLDTPIPVVDFEIVTRNIKRLQQACDAQNIQNYPHFKTHKSIRLAKQQIEAGAVGMTCQKISEAEILVEAGVRNIIISYNIIGAPKAARLRALCNQATLTVACDSPVVAQFLSEAMSGAGEPLEVFVECDTGRKRSGVVSASEVAELAQLITDLPNLSLAGLLFYPPSGDLSTTQNFLNEARRACSERGLALPRISSGGTPNLGQIGQLGETEYRAGTYIYNDRATVEKGAARLEDCALLIYATVVSKAEPGRAIIDAGSKTLTSDLAIFKDYGYLIDYPEARISSLTEEHGNLDLAACDHEPEIGEVVRILPNHVCPVVNLFDQVLCAESGEITGTLKTDARGRVT